MRGGGHWGGGAGVLGACLALTCRGEARQTVFQGVASGCRAGQSQGGALGAGWGSINGGGWRGVSRQMSSSSNQVSQVHRGSAGRRVILGWRLCQCISLAICSILQWLGPPAISPRFLLSRAQRCLLADCVDGAIDYLLQYGVLSVSDVVLNREQTSDFQTPLRSGATPTCPSRDVLGGRRSAWPLGGESNAAFLPCLW